MDWLKRLLGFGNQVQQNVQKAVARPAVPKINVGQVVNALSNPLGTARNYALSKGLEQSGKVGQQAVKGFSNLQGVQQLKQAVPVVGTAGRFVNQELIQPTLKSSIRFGQAGQGKDVYDRGLKGAGQILGDTVNLASLIPGFGAAKELASAPKLANAARAFGANALVGAGAGLSQGLQRDNINARQLASDIAVPAALGGALGTGGALLAAATKRGAKVAGKVSNELGQDGFIAGSKATDYEKALASKKVFVGADNKPRFEVSDKGMKVQGKGLLSLNKGETEVLSNVIDHKELFKQYPQLKGVKIVLDNAVPAGQSSVYNELTDTIHLSPTIDTPEELWQSLIHENQHAIQGTENFARGTTPKQNTSQSVQDLEALMSQSRPAFEAEARQYAMKRDAIMAMPQSKQRDDMLRQLGDEFNNTPVAREHDRLQYELQKEYKKLPQGDPMNAYKRSLGEVEAHIVEERARLSQKQLDKNPLNPDYGVDPNQVVKSFKPGQSAAARNTPQAKGVDGKFTSDPTSSLKQEALKYKSADEFVDTNNTIKVPISDFQKTDSTSWNEAVSNVSRRNGSKSTGPVEVVMTPNGYKLIEGNHRAVEALNSGKSTIEAKVVSKEGLDAIARRDGPHIKIGQQDTYTKQQLTDLYNQAHSTKFDISFEPGQSARVAEKERKFIDTARKSENTVPEVASKIKGDYGPITNKETIAQAEQKINQIGFEKAVDISKNSAEYTLENQAVALRVADELQGLGRYQDAIDVIEKTAERATSAGQAVQIAAAWNKLQPEGVLLLAQRTIDKAKLDNPNRFGKLTLKPADAERIRGMAEKLQGLTGVERDLATRKMLEEIQRLVPTPAMTKAITLWKAGLLTGIKGQLGNQVGNSSNAVLRKLSDIPAAGIDAAIGKLTNQRGKTLTLKGLFEGGKEGFKIGKSVLKTGMNPLDPATKKYDVQKTLFSKSPLGKAAQTYTDTIFNMTSASDKPYYYATLKNSLYDQAGALAKTQKLSGKEAGDFIKKTVASPPDDLLVQATADAQEAVFAQDNAIGAALKGLKRGLKSKGGALGEAAAEINIPFTGVPSAIATEVLNYTPVGAVKGVYQAIKNSQGSLTVGSQRKLSEALGKAMTGTGLLWLGAELTKTGQMTLGYPTDEKERQLWDQEKKQPYAIQIGGKWRSLNYSGPIGAVLAAGGEVLKNGPVSATTQAAKAVVAQSPLRGIQGGLDAITGTAADAKRYVQSTAGSVIPTLSKDIAQATDLNDKGKVNTRVVNNPLEGIQDRIPGARQSLLVDHNVFGEAKDTGRGAVASIADPLRSTEAKSSPLTGELRRLFDAGQGTMPSEVKSKLKVGGEEVTLTPVQQDTYQQFVGGNIKNAWKEAIQSPEYKTLDDEKKRKLLDNIKDDINAASLVTFARQVAIGNTQKALENLSTKQKAILNNGFDLAGYTAVATKQPKAASVAKLSKASGRKKATGRISLSLKKPSLSKAPKVKIGKAKITKGKSAKAPKTRKIKFKVA